MKMIMFKKRMKSAVILALAMMCFLAAAPDVRAESHKEMTGVVSKMLINATPQEIFRAIHDYRYSDSTKRSVLEEKKGRCIIKEKFAGLPILGDVDCTYEEVETPYSRIDYQMVNSDKLTVFEGNWILSPVEGTNTTLVKLTSYIDSGLTIPAKDFLTHLSAHQDLHKRLSYVKKQAESIELKREEDEPKKS
jgi:hypothetical protein